MPPALNLLGEYPGKFRSYLEAEHYSQQSIREGVRCIKALEGVMKERRVNIVDLDEDCAVNLIGSLGGCRSRRMANKYIVKNFVRFLTASGAGKAVVPPTR